MRDNDTINALATLPVWLIEALRDIATNTELTPAVRCTIFHGAFKSALLKKSEADE